MKNQLMMTIAAVTLAAVAGTPAFAANAKQTRHHVTCKQIKEAVDGGKSSEDVQQEMHVTAARVKACTMPTAKTKTKAPTEKPS